MQIVLPTTIKFGPKRGHSVLYNVQRLCKFRTNFKSRILRVFTTSNTRKKMADSSACAFFKSTVPPADVASGMFYTSIFLTHAHAMHFLLLLQSKQHSATQRNTAQHNTTIPRCSGCYAQRFRLLRNSQKREDCVCDIRSGRKFANFFACLMIKFTRIRKTHNQENTSLCRRHHRSSGEKYCALH